MRRFKWIEWNLNKIAAHALSQEDVEAAFSCIHDFCEATTDHLKSMPKHHQEGAFG